MEISAIAAAQPELAIKNSKKKKISSGLIFAGTATLGIASLAMPQLTLLSAATGITEYYTRLTVSLGRTPLSVIPEDLRYHFIRLVSSLTCYQIAFARELKIRKMVPVRGTASFEEAELALTGLDSGMAMQAVRALQNTAT
ncbi:hypothetical protein CQT90_19230 [Salmonella enterica]|nr:hypothetical protein [Salmonella enterica]ECX8200540.1 hypothetical protein [Salmonella enterica]EKH2097085.1 hypothetical protein [Salmonella enterica]EKJ6037545.1 hypothetical protein [Salmonella enterica]